MICKICNNDYKSGSGFATHVKTKHDITYIDYLIKKI